MIDILNPIIEEIRKAGEVAYRHYRSDVSVQIKADDSPVTNVDTMIHAMMIDALGKWFPDVPVVSEEGVIPSHKDRQNMSAYWLLDPLDGTVDFINQTDQFVISLGYIQNQQPTMGVIHHPVSNNTWVAVQGRGVFIQPHAQPMMPISPLFNKARYTILVSAFRNDDALSQIIARQRQKEWGLPVDIKPIGSALKFAYLADGRGDEYLRFTPMKEWDLAGGHCLALEAGFRVDALDQVSSIQYGTQDMLVPPVSVRRIQSTG